METFTDLGLNPSILRAIQDLQFVTPTPVQKKVIPLLINEKKDIIALAQTGTGKTAAFGFPILQMADFSKKHVQALILSPTRELCMQITNDLRDYAKYMDKVNIVAVYGGASIVDQLRQLERGAHIVVATPGRMVDIIERRRIDISKLQWVVLDEADEMLNMGFKEELNAILEETPDDKNMLMFSATMPKEIAKIAKKYMDDPIEVVCGTRNTGADNVEHIYYVTHTKNRYLTLKRIADFNPDIYAMIFCRTKSETQEVADWLIKDGYNADSLHGDLSQFQRDIVMKKFRNKNIQLLVCTDVAARGLDVDDLTHSINYNLPDDIEQYTHRSGRTGRAGKSGVSISIVQTKDVHRIKAIEKQVGKPMNYSKIPSGEEVCEKQLFNLIRGVTSVEVNEQAIAEYLPMVYEELSGLDKEEIIKRFVSVEFNRFLTYYKKSNDLNINKEDVRQSENANRMYINLGKMDGLNKDSLKKYIYQTVDTEQFRLIDLEVFGNCSFFEATPENVEIMMDAFARIRYQGRQIRINSASKSEKSEGGGGRRRRTDSENRSENRSSDRRGERRRSDDSSEKRSDRRSDRFRKFDSDKDYKKRRNSKGGQNR